MARFIPVNLRVGARVAAGLGGLILLSAAAQAQAPMQAPMQGMAPAAPASAPGPTPATNAAASARPPLPVPVQNTLSRYGNIVLPGDAVQYPLKLKLPFPGVGEVKLPKPDELVMRQKLEALAKLSDDEIRKQLAQWPAFNRMSLRDEGAMLQRIQDFRDYRSRFAAQKAHDMGLLTLTPDQRAKFEKEFWDKRLAMDQDLSKQFLPVFQAHEQKLEADLFREFSSTTPGPVLPAPRPPANKPTASKPPQPSAAPPVARTNPPAGSPAIGQAPQ